MSTETKLQRDLIRVKELLKNPEEYAKLTMQELTALCVSLDQVIRLIPEKSIDMHESESVQEEHMHNPDLPVNDMIVTNRVRLIMQRARFVRIQDVLDAGPEGLLEKREIGAKTYAEICRALNAYGFEDWSDGRRIDATAAEAYRRQRVADGKERRHG